jgi:hypothetical protein
MKAHFWIPGVLSESTSTSCRPLRLQDMQTCYMVSMRGNSLKAHFWIPRVLSGSTSTSIHHVGLSGASNTEGSFHEQQCIEGGWGFIAVGWSPHFG